MRPANTALVALVVSSASSGCIHLHSRYYATARALGHRVDLSEILTTNASSRGPLSKQTTRMQCGQAIDQQTYSGSSRLSGKSVQSPTALTFLIPNKAPRSPAMIIGTTSTCDDSDTQSNTINSTGTTKLCSTRFPSSRGTDPLRLLVVAHLSMSGCT